MRRYKYDIHVPSSDRHITREASSALVAVQKCLATRTRGEYKEKKKTFLVVCVSETQTIVTSKETGIKYFVKKGEEEHAPSS